MRLRGLQDTQCPGSQGAEGGEEATAGNPQRSAPQSEDKKEVKTPALKAFGRDLTELDRETFDTSQRGQDLSAFKDETREIMPDRPVSDLDRYYDRHKRLGTDADQPHRIKYKPLVRPG